MVRVASLQPQLFIGRKEPNSHHFNPVSNDEGFGVKPRGGLWTSTYGPVYGSGWVDWCLSEDYNVPPDGRFASWLLEPNPTAVVLEIDSYEDLQVLVESDYGIDGPGYALRLGGRGINFEKLATWGHIDAIHLTERGQWATRLSHPHTLYGWDCESTLWLRWAFVKVENLGYRRWMPAEAPKPEPAPQRLRSPRIEF
jgi:hypothetical protein